MTYGETLDFLFNRLQSFHNDGAKAYKPGLEKALRLSRAFGNPHEKFRSIHVGGTNGKGSTAHSLCSILMAAGLKVGLYTSPHIIDFTERIRINGKPIEKDAVIDFVDRFRKMGLTDTDPSFFELTTIMAFEYFARNKVDIAVIEVGLGGRLDTTNIITPVLSVITNISFDHTALLGHTLEEIAREKAGIIKPGVPVVIGRRHAETDGVFASVSGNRAVFAPDRQLVSECEIQDGTMLCRGTPWGDIEYGLTGDCQKENIRTILTAVSVLQDAGVAEIPAEAIRMGLKEVVNHTGLTGRWMKVSDRPAVIADTAHNVDGWKYIAPRLKAHSGPLFMVIGFVSDKDYCSILDFMPKDARFYFVRPSVARAAKPETIAEAAGKVGIKGKVFNNVADGFVAARDEAARHDDALVYVGGSTFVVADFLAWFQERR